MNVCRLEKHSKIQESEDILIVIEESIILRYDSPWNFTFRKDFQSIVFDLIPTAIKRKKNSITLHNFLGVRLSTFERNRVRKQTLRYSFKTENAKSL